MADSLYNYLDAAGGLAMLFSKTLMFANATQVNDPYECHPALDSFPSDASGLYQGIPAVFYSQMKYQKGLNRRDDTYICSLLKVWDSILMWSYYNKHQGVCIGLNMNKTRNCYKRMFGLFQGCPELEVQYKSIINGHYSTEGPNDMLCYHFATKAKDWQYEQEVRLIAYIPSPVHMRLFPEQYEEDALLSKIKHLFQKTKKPKQTMDGKDIRVFLDIGGECFESVYLGVRMKQDDREKIVRVARKCNPEINNYQMTIDPRSFRLKEQMIEQ